VALKKAGGLVFFNYFLNHIPMSGKGDDLRALIACMLRRLRSLSMYQI